MKIRVLTALILCLVIGCSKTDDKTAADPSSQTPADSLVIELKGIEGKSVFDILNENHTVDYRSSAMGIFVKSIDSITAGSGYFWLYSVNDSMAQIAADQYITDDNDIIKWHLRRTGK